MDDYAGRVLADRYRLPLPPSDEYELTETRAFDTYSGQEVLVRQVPLPEVVEAEVLDAEGLPDGFTARDGTARRGGTGPGAARTTRRPADPVVRRAVEAAQAAAALPDHPRLDQVFDVFAEGGSLWIVSELVAARPLAALLAEQPLSPYRAAEVASDVLTALRVLHSHGWVHRNITARTILVCDDGRVMLTGLAVGAAEEALCGYDPVPERDDGSGPERPGEAPGAPGPPHQAPPGTPGAGQGPSWPPGLTAATGPGADPDAARRAAIEARAGRLPDGGADTPGGLTPAAAPRALDSAGDVRAARAGAIAAYRAGARAAARVQEAQQSNRAALPGARPAPEDDGPAPAASPPGRIADPYGVGATGWNGAAPGTGGPPAIAEGSGRTAPGETADPTGPGALEAAAAPAPPARWDDLVAQAPARRGPTTALAAERARQARMAVVGPVTERWAPEQAGPVHDNWQLAAPIGPATDLWALGSMLFRAVQGHAPYPEESTAELVQMVCAEPPAFAEECGPLRPVVESLLRQDPTERPEFEELRGWLRSLVRSAPEPEAGVHVIAAPPAAETSRLPVIRRRGELVRRRRAGLPAHHGRHKRAKQGTSPRRLGRTLLLLVLLAMAAAIAYAMLFMPKAGEENTGAGTPDRTGAAGEVSNAPSEPGPDGEASKPADGPGKSPEESAAADETQTTGPEAADGFTLRKDPEGFSVAVAENWQRAAKNGSGQVVYSRGDFELIVVPGRDSADRYGSDPMAYQRDDERELQPYRDSSWATSTGLKTIEVGGRTMAEGQFTWTGDSGDLYVRNLAALIDGRYHVVQVRGPEAQRDEVTRLYEQAAATYRYTG
ncbi:protein kinase domain-containing protein [Streptomyces sp. WAC 01420]|uniref:protein kinase domain-containing protein n=1 Tax=Streptomyces sp. WAC 01420 TaxID=2203203 RepID=UPI000F888CEC|nr:protein kinase [Streptomyces sp. WAC 01420]RSM98535.1 serine/threonine protein kinase [Streptomyces sp. WAC 01420]